MSVNTYKHTGLFLMSLWGFNHMFGGMPKLAIPISASNKEEAKDIDPIGGIGIKAAIGSFAAIASYYAAYSVARIAAIGPDRMQAIYNRYADAIPNMENLGQAVRDMETINIDEPVPLEPPAPMETPAPSKSPAPSKPPKKKGEFIIVPDMDEGLVGYVRFNPLAHVEEKIEEEYEKIHVGETKEELRIKIREQIKELDRIAGLPHISATEELPLGLVPYGERLSLYTPLDVEVPALAFRGPIVEQPRPLQMVPYVEVVQQASDPEEVPKEAESEITMEETEESEMRSLMESTFIEEESSEILDLVTFGSLIGDINISQNDMNIINSMPILDTQKTVAKVMVYLKSIEPGEITLDKIIYLIIYMSKSKLVTSTLRALKMDIDALSYIHGLAVKFLDASDDVENKFLEILISIRNSALSAAKNITSTNYRIKIIMAIMHRLNRAQLPDINRLTMYSILITMRISQKDITAMSRRKNFLKVYKPFILPGLDMVDTIARSVKHLLSKYTRAQLLKQGMSAKIYASLKSASNK
ncbi:MAG: hypothetical protein ACTSRK_18295 [Promethearchaeota archaeon]